MHLLSKERCFYVFLAYKAIVENQFGYQIHKLRTFSGDYYVNNKSINYFTTQDIPMLHIVPYKPQQNGVAGKKNHTFKKIKNCMIQSK